MWICRPHPQPLQSTQEEPSYPEAGSPAQSQQQYNIKGTTDQMKRLHHKPILHTRHEDTDCENPLSRLECEQTHVAKTNLHKIWAY